MPGNAGVISKYLSFVCSSGLSMASNGITGLANLIRIWLSVATIPDGETCTIHGGSDGVGNAATAGYGYGPPALGSIEPAPLTARSAAAAMAASAIIVPIFMAGPPKNFCRADLYGRLADDKHRHYSGPGR